MVGKKKTTQGRRKIAIEKIASEEARNVCFSKRRNGVFTKATDLATLCGAELAIMVMSPAGNPYSFGSPGVNEVVNRFLVDNNTESAGSTSRSMQFLGHRMNLVRKLNNQCMEFSRQMDCANAKKSMLEAQQKSLVESYPICQLAADDIEGLRLAELQKVQTLLVGLKNRLDAMISDIMRGGGALSSSNSMIAAAAKPTRVIMNQFSYGPPQQAHYAGNTGYAPGFY